MKLLFFLFFYPYLLSSPITSLNDEGSVYRYNSENVLGTSFELKVAALSEQEADYAELIALMEIERLNAILSTYDASSEVSQWQKTMGNPVKISPELFEVLSLFKSWSKRTEGALTASIGIASAIWKKAETNQSIPDKEALKPAIEEMMQPQWLLNQENETATKLTSHPLVLNSFVKSYIIAKVSDKLIGLPGVKGVVVNIGGDIVITGNLSETVQIADPTADAEDDHPIRIVKLNGRAIATSGNYRRGYQIGNKWFSHIIDPRTAYPVNHIKSATVIAENPTDAGALATAFNVLQPEESVKLASTIKGVEYLLITSDGKEIASDGWHSMEESANGATPFFKPEGNKLIIEFELATFEGRFRRPFVAVWVENKKKETVKNIAIWYNKPRWLPDLKRWYSKNQTVMQDSTAKASISSATRAPGKYTLSWDGLDDHGKPVPQGKYTVYIEAAREHGTYQLMKQEIEWNGKPAHFDLEGGIEIKSGSLTITN